MKLIKKLKETESRLAQQKKVHETTIYEFHVPFSVVLVVFQSISSFYQFYVPFSVVLVMFQSISTFYK
jgi:hypothetical protein